MKNVFYYPAIEASTIPQPRNTVSSDAGKSHEAVAPTFRQILLHVVSFELRCWLLPDQQQKASSWVSTLLNGYSVHAHHALVMELVIHKQYRKHVTLKCSMIFRKIHLLFAKNHSSLFFSLLLSRIQKLIIKLQLMQHLCTPNLAQCPQSRLQFSSTPHQVEDFRKDY